MYTLNIYNFCQLYLKEAEKNVTILRPSWRSDLPYMQIPPIAQILSTWLPANPTLTSHPQGSSKGIALGKLEVRGLFAPIELAAFHVALSRDGLEG